MRRLEARPPGAPLTDVKAGQPPRGFYLGETGATTVQRRVLEPGAEPLKAATGIQVKLFGPGAGKGMIALIEGKVPVAAAGEALEDAVAAAEAGKFITVPANLVHRPVASDNIPATVRHSPVGWR
jgi:phosphate transport system substrate-binding protein